MDQVAESERHLKSQTPTQVVSGPGGACALWVFQISTSACYRHLRSAFCACSRLPQALRQCLSPAGNVPVIWTEGLDLLGIFRCLLLGLSFEPMGLAATAFLSNMAGKRGAVQLAPPFQSLVHSPELCKTRVHIAPQETQCHNSFWLGACLNSQAGGSSG